MTVVNEIEVYEHNGTKTMFGQQSMRVHSHWNDSDMVVVEVGGEKYTVVGAELERCIRNARNVR